MLIFSMSFALGRLHLGGGNSNMFLNVHPDLLKEKMNPIFDDCTHIFQLG